MVNVTYEQNNWVIDLIETWKIGDEKEVISTTDFLIKNKIPYRVNYTDNEVIIDVNIQRVEPVFNKMMGLVNELLVLQERMTKIKTTQPIQTMSGTMNQQPEPQQPTPQRDIRNIFRR